MDINNSLTILLNTCTNNDTGYFSILMTLINPAITEIFFILLTITTYQPYFYMYSQLHQHWQLLYVAGINNLLLQWPWQLLHYSNTNKYFTLLLLTTSLLPKTLTTSLLAKALATSLLAKALATSLLPKTLKTSLLPKTLKTSLFPKTLATSLLHWHWEPIYFTDLGNFLYFRH